MKTSLQLIAALAFLGFTLTRCGGEAPAKKDFSKEVDEGKFNGSTYTNETLGWKITFPETWIVTSKSSLEAMDKRSKEVSGDAAVSTDGIERLLAFQKNFDNNFQSTREPFNGKGDAAYQQIKYSIREKLYLSYLDQKFSIDTVSSVQKIDGLDFDCFEIKLYDRNGERFATQLLYTKIIADNYFNVIINYSNEGDKMKMVECFKKSTFSKRN